MSQWFTCPACRKMVRLKAFFGTLHSCVPQNPPNCLAEFQHYYHNVYKKQLSSDEMDIALKFFSAGFFCAHGSEVRP